MAKENKLKSYLRRHAFIVVFIVAAIIAAANYFVYPLFITRDLKLIDVPVAKQTIPEGTLITEDMLTTVSVSKEFLPHGIYLDDSYIVGKYVMQNNSIPTNGFFYAETISDKESSMGLIFKELQEGEYAYTLKVNERFCQGTNLKEGQIVNVYFYCWTSLDNTSGEGEIASQGVVEGLLAENKRIISVTGEPNTSQYITIAVTEEEMAYLTSGVEIATHYSGEVYPIVYYGSDATDIIQTSYFNVDEMKMWIKEHSQMYVLSEIERNNRQNKTPVVEPEDVEEVTGGEVLDGDN